MSIKMYTAWRVAGEGLPAFLTALDAHVWERIVAQTERLASEGLDRDAVQRRLKEKPLMIERHGGTADAAARISIAMELVAKASFASSRLPGVDVDMAFVAMPDKGFYVLWPVGESALVAGFDPASAGGQDWGYWDNVDPDPSVSVEEWSERGESWNRISAPDQLRLFHVLVDIKEPLRCDGERLASALAAKMGVTWDGRPEALGWALTFPARDMAYQRRLLSVTAARAMLSIPELPLPLQEWLDNASDLDPGVGLEVYRAREAG